MPGIVATPVAARAAYVLLDVRLPAGAGVPPHSLTREDLLVVVLDGRLAVDERTLGAGEHVAIARGARRTLRAVTDVRALCLLAPAGLEALLPLLGEPLEPDDVRAHLAVAGVVLLPPTRPASA